MTCHFCIFFLTGIRDVVLMMNLKKMCPFFEGAEDKSSYTSGHMHKLKS